MYAPGPIIYTCNCTVPYQYPVMGATLSAPAPAVTIPLTVPSSSYRVPTAPRQGPIITDLNDPPPPYSASTSAQGTARTSTACAPAQSSQQLVQGLQSSMESFTSNAQFLSNLATSINKVVTIKFMPGSAVSGAAGIEMTITDKETRQLSLPPGKIQPRRYRRRYQPEYRHRMCYCWDCCESYGSYHSRNRPEYRHRPCLCDDCLDDED